MTLADVISDCRRKFGAREIYTYAKHCDAEHTAPWGDADASAVFDLGCISEFLVSALLYDHVFRNGLNAETRLRELSMGSDLERHDHLDGVTVVDLTRHSAGFLSLNWPGDETTYLQNLERTPRAFPPSQIVNYHGIEQRLAVRLLQTITGDLSAAMDRSLFQPAGTRLTRSFTNEKRKLAVQAGLADVPRLVAFLLGTIFSKGAFKSAIAENFLSIYTPLNANSPLLACGYSWGLARFATGLWGSSGTAREHSIAIRFDLNLEFIVILICAGSGVRRDLILHEVLNYFGYAGPPVEADLVGSLGAYQRQDVCGVYTGGDLLHAVVAGDGDAISIRAWGRSSLSDPIGVFAVVEAHVATDGTLHGTNSFRGSFVEFFRHPLFDVPCFTFGPIAFVRRDTDDERRGSNPA